MRFSLRASATVAFAVLAALPVPGRAQTPTHVYTLDGVFTDALGGPAMTSGGGTLGPTAYSFAAGQGPSLSNAINPNVYSIEMLFSISLTSGYRKLLDFKNRSSDNGLYSLNGALNFYPVTAGPGGAIGANAPVHLVATRNSAGIFAAYVNGVQQLSFNDASGYARFTGPGAIAHFLRDDSATSTEQSAGILQYVRIYDAPLTSQEVAGRYDDRFNQLGGVSTVPEPLSMALLGTGLAGLGGLRRRRSRAA